MRNRQKPRQILAFSLVLLFSLFWSLEAFAVGPGGIDTNLQLWLRGDVGVTSASGNVTAWAD